MKKILIVVLNFMILISLFGCTGKKEKISLYKAEIIFEEALEKTLSLKKGNIKIKNIQSDVIYESGCSYDQEIGFRYYANFYSTDEQSEATVNGIYNDGIVDLYLDYNDGTEKQKIKQKLSEETYIKILNDININALFYRSDMSYGDLLENVFSNDYEFGTMEIEEVTLQKKVYTYKIKYKSDNGRFSSSILIRVENGIISYYRETHSGGYDYDEFTISNNVEKIEVLNKSGYSMGILEHLNFGYGW